MDRYDEYTCKVCSGSGDRRNESQNLVNRAARVPCFCYGGRVLVLHGFRPPWYAGTSVPPIPGEKGYNPQKMTVANCHKAMARKPKR